MHFVRAKKRFDFHIKNKQLTVEDNETSPTCFPSSVACTVKLYCAFTSTSNFPVTLIVPEYGSLIEKESENK